MVTSRDYSGVFNMTMNIPAAAQNPSKQHCYGSSSFGDMNRLEEYYNNNHNHNNYGCSETCLLLGSSSSSSDHHHHHHLLLVSPPPPPSLPPPLMADHQDESRTESVNEAGSSSNYYQDEEEADHHHHVGWLQLGIGNQSQISQPQPNNNNKVEEEDQESSRRSGGLVELDLLPTGGNITNNISSEELRSLMIRDRPRPISSLFVNSSSSSSYNNHNNYNSSFPLHHHHQEIINSSWGGFIRPFPRNYNYFARPFQLIHTDGLVASRPPPPPPPPLHANSIDFRVIDPPPPRPHSGIWFMLQAAQIQVKEPFLPQIPKSFLRTRDGRMTIRLVIKYLVNKLKLESESEVEIRCRGQQILPFLTLQHVRDSIWSPRDSFVTLLPTPHDSSSSSSSSTTAADHVMVLHYGRSP